MIEKIQKNTELYRIHLYYYKRARDAMFDAVKQLVSKGYKDIYIPGYIGWSPKEGSGIFDPLNCISELARHYYQMTRGLSVNAKELKAILNDNSILLVVNYFGFRDIAFEEIVKLAKSRGCIVVEDNAHGFYTYYCNGSAGTDVTFFSLHKMFPFSEGGALLIENQNIGITASDNIYEPVEYNPFTYDINEIARVRKNNFCELMELMKGNEKYFLPLRNNYDIEKNVPQTFPIVIKKGDRDAIYEIMNDEGYGVVSLYHTMIEELRNGDHEDACWLSQRIMNLPIHQDVNSSEYQGMIDRLVTACEETEGGSHS